jgi:hypothetical protein
VGPILALRKVNFFNVKLLDFLLVGAAIYRGMENVRSFQAKKQFNHAIDK